MLIVLDANPIKAAEKMPESICYKQLLELMQMLSFVVNFGYDKIPQGKEIKEWISNNKIWVYEYTEALFSFFCTTVKNPKKQTLIKYKCLLDLLKCECENEKYKKPTTAILRYKDGYECKYPTNTELPIEECINIYQDYTKWKGWQ